MFFYHGARSMQLKNTLYCTAIWSIALWSCSHQKNASNLKDQFYSCDQYGNCQLVDRPNTNDDWNCESNARKFLTQTDGIDVIKYRTTYQVMLEAVKKSPQYHTPSQEPIDFETWLPSRHVPDEHQIAIQERPGVCANRDTPQVTERCRGFAFGSTDDDSCGEIYVGRLHFPTVTIDYTDGLVDLTDHVFSDLPDTDELILSLDPEDLNHTNSQNILDLSGWFVQAVTLYNNNFPISHPEAFANLHNLHQLQIFDPNAPGDDAKGLHRLLDFIWRRAGINTVSLLNDNRCLESGTCSDIGRSTASIDLGYIRTLQRTKGRAQKVELHLEEKNKTSHPALANNGLTVMNTTNFFGFQFDEATNSCKSNQTDDQFGHLMPSEVFTINPASDLSITNLASPDSKCCQAVKAYCIGAQADWTRSSLNCERLVCPTL